MMIQWIIIISHCKISENSPMWECQSPKLSGSLYKEMRDKITEEWIRMGRERRGGEVHWGSFHLLSSATSLLLFTAAQLSAAQQCCVVESPKLRQHPIHSEKKETWQKTFRNSRIHRGMRSVLRSRGIWFSASLTLSLPPSLIDILFWKCNRAASGSIGCVASVPSFRFG